MSSENSVATVYCGGCGGQIDARANFCRGCGADQSQFANSGTETPRPDSSADTSEPDRQSDVQMHTPGVAPLPPGPTGRGSIFASPWRTPAGQRRSAAWIYYALIALGGLILGFQHPAFLLVAAIAGLYSTYLFRGGRFVIWFW